MVHISLEKLDDFAREFAQSLTPSQHATVLALYGDLGAGKTTFVKALARALGVEETITSPTFVIEKIYALPKGPFARLIHIDTYRLEKSQELLTLGWEEALSDPGHLIVVEWGEKIEELLPANTKRLRFAVVSDNVRDISYD